MDGTWNSLAASHPQGHPMHASEWLFVLDEAFKTPVYCLVGKSGDRLTALASLWESKSKFFGHSIHSLDGGLIAPDPLMSANCQTTHWCPQLLGTGTGTSMCLRCLRVTGVCR